MRYHASLRHARRALLASTTLAAVFAHANPDYVLTLYGTGTNPDRLISAYGGKQLGVVPGAGSNHLYTDYVDTPFGTYPADVDLYALWDGGLAGGQRYATNPPSTVTTPVLFRPNFALVDTGHDGLALSVWNDICAGFTDGYALPKRAAWWQGGGRYVLHPNGYTESELFDVFADLVTGGFVGRGSISGGTSHALYWPNLGSSGVVDLTPDGYEDCQAVALDSIQQVGFGSIGGVREALRWQGTPESAEPIGQPWFMSSQATDTSNGIISGWGLNVNSQGSNAWLLDLQSPNPFVDLHAILEAKLALPNVLLNSEALGIDPVSGDVVGRAWEVGDSSRTWPVVWRRTECHDLSVDSSEPNGVNINATLDIRFRGLGETPFVRRYEQGTPVALGVGTGVLPGNRLFDHFDLDGTPISGPLVMDEPHAVTAVYVQGYTLALQSSNPNANIPLTVWTQDYYKRKNGSTPFNRLYKSGTAASVTAPAVVGTQAFLRWERNGVPVAGTARTISQTMSANATLKAVYSAARTLSITSGPVTAVPITVYTPDVNAQTNGSTNFTRIYVNGATVSFNAPASSGGKAFQRWEKDGVPQPLGVRTVTVTMSGNRAIKAVYNP